MKAKEYFQDKEGKFFRAAADMVVMYCVMELACGRVHKIPDVHYLYNINTGLNDQSINRDNQVKADESARFSPPLKCSSAFDEKMKKLEKPQ